MASHAVSELEMEQQTGKPAAPAVEGTGAERANPETTDERRQKTVSFIEILQRGSDEEIVKKYAQDARGIAEKYPALAERYFCLALLEPETSIDNYELDRIFSALQAGNAAKEKDILLILLSPGGQIEPAYQISKLCKTYARERFTAVVPRNAKSAATLIALGADEIHMGPLGQLGPIDPQLGGLPALGVSQALNRIASVAQQYPKSADMLARYLRLVLSVEQIGYCERISESAEQYAQRLLAKKPHLEAEAATIAHDLVHTYKDHSFVIDLDEAREHLGGDWVKDGTDELKFAEDLYTSFRLYNLFLRKKRLVVVGDLFGGAVVWPKED